MTDIQTAPPRAAVNNVRLTCPHCDGPAGIRTSKSVSRTARQGIVECRNDECGWRGQFDLAMTQTYTPAADPRADVHLPLSPEILRRMRQHLGELDEDDEPADTAGQARRA